MHSATRATGSSHHARRLPARVRKRRRRRQQCPRLKWIPYQSQLNVDHICCLCIIHENRRFPKSARGARLQFRSSAALPHIPTSCTEAKPGYSLALSSTHTDHTHPPGEGRRSPGPACSASDCTPPCHTQVAQGSKGSGPRRLSLTTPGQRGQLNPA